MPAMSKTRRELADMFLATLKEDRLPWKAVWNQARPFNPVSGVTYRGVNNLMLNYIAEQRGYADPRWCTFHQAKAKGWAIKKGAKAARVEYWAYVDPENNKLLSWADARKIQRKDPERFQRLELRCRISSVFNGEQIRGIPEYQRPRGTSIDAIRGQRDTLLEHMQLSYREAGDRAYYSPAEDQVTLPPENTFDSPYGYLCTFLHECGHATGHPHRLDRDLSGGFGSEQYAREELRAEIASAFTAQELGLVMPEEEVNRYLDLHKAYIQSWISVLENNPEELFAAIRDAGKISDYLMEAGEFQREPQPLYLQQPVRFQVGALTATLENNLLRGGLTLTVSGAGSLQGMEDNPDLQPYRKEVTEIHLEEGVTGVGDRAFRRMGGLQRIVLPSSLREIGYSAFNDCPRLREAAYHGSVDQWDAVHKAPGFLPRQFRRERMIADSIRNDPAYVRGPEDTPEPVQGQLVLVADQTAEAQQADLEAQAVAAQQAELNASEEASRETAVVSKAAKLAMAAGAAALAVEAGRYQIITWSRDIGCCDELDYADPQEALDAARRYFMAGEEGAVVYDKAQGQIVRVYGYVPDTALPQEVSPEIRITEFREQDLVFQAHVEGNGIDRWAAVRSQGEQLFVRTSTALEGPCIEHRFTAEEHDRYMAFEARAMEPQPARMTEIQVNVNAEEIELDM